MIRFKFIFGPSIPLSEARVRFENRPAPVNLYYLIFMGIAALFHPSDQLSSAPIMLQVAFWGTGFLLFLFGFRLMQVLFLRLAVARGWTTLYVQVPLELTVNLLALYLYGFALWFGIPTDDWRDLAEFYVFCVVLFELGAFCYISYADRTVYPEVYETKGPKSAAQMGAQTSRREIFLRGSTIPVHQVEVIVAQGNGVEATGLGQSAFIARPFGKVVSELPMDLGFQIHRSLWLARDLAVNFATDGRKHLVVLPDGRRFPVARSRQRDYRKWLALVTQSRT
jgi:hypothetical protein